MNDHVHPLLRDLLNGIYEMHTGKPAPEPKPNPERLQKRCEACCGTGRTDSGDDCYQRCDVCGGEGMLP